MPEPLEDLVRELVSSVVDSFEKLEAIVACAKSADAPLPLSVLKGSIGETNATEIREALEDLVGDGVLVSAKNATGEDTFAVNPDGPWTKHVTALSTMHASNRMNVAMLMSNAALERVRRRAERVFADAFLIHQKNAKDKKTRGNTDDE